MGLQRGQIGTGAEGSQGCRVQQGRRATLACGCWARLAEELTGQRWCCTSGSASVASGGVSRKKTKNDSFPLYDLSLIFVLCAVPITPSYAKPWGPPRKEAISLLPNHILHGQGSDFPSFTIFQ
ncbi:hypothetical protein NL676_007286 [Syzygium grande]|nr:hypothetical protein NL676_007286 [Syzygium grande]